MSRTGFAPLPSVSTLFADDTAAVTWCILPGEVSWYDHNAARRSASRLAAASSRPFASSASAAARLASASARRA